MELSDLLEKESEENIPEEHLVNLRVLLGALRHLEKKLGRKLQVTSGYRTLEHHLEIYAAKGITDTKKIPMKSKHLIGCACDLYDPDGELKYLVRKDDYSLLKECWFWMEDGTKTENWLHVQMIEPASGRREFFI